MSKLIKLHTFNFCNFLCFNKAVLKKTANIYIFLRRRESSLRPSHHTLRHAGRWGDVLSVGERVGTLLTPPGGTWHPFQGELGKGATAVLEVVAEAFEHCEATSDPPQ